MDSNFRDNQSRFLPSIQKRLLKSNEADALERRGVRGLQAFSPFTLRAAWILIAGLPYHIQDDRRNGGDPVTPFSLFWRDVGAAEGSLIAQPRCSFSNRGFQERTSGNKSGLLIVSFPMQNQ
jgi:hypothetical protein